MAVLRKIKGSTLMETLVATVLIVVIFMMASMVLNNVFANNIRQNTKEIEYELTRLQYLNRHRKLILPYQDSKGDWSITASKVEWKGRAYTFFTATNTLTSKEVEYKVVYE